MLNTLAGSAMESEANEIINSARPSFGPRFERARTAQLLWLLGAWYAHVGNQEQVRYASEALESLAVEQGDRRSRMFADAIAAHYALAQGDTSAAIARFRALRPTAGPAQLAWGMAEGLPYEMVKLAELLLAQGEYREAIEVATILDHSTCITYIPFVRRSLMVRLRAADAMADEVEADAYRDRLHELTITVTSPRVGGD
jgi:hypothetical protein